MQLWHRSQFQIKNLMRIMRSSYVLVMTISLKLESLTEQVIDPTYLLIDFGKKRQRIISRKSNQMSLKVSVFQTWLRIARKRLIR